MDLIEQIKTNLDTIKSLNGVENAVLTQRDGNPITSSGVWLSKNEIFQVSASTSAMYNVGLSLHGEWLKYMVVEGPKAKIMIAPLHRDIKSNASPSQNIDGISEYFIALTTLSNVNLGSLFIKTQLSLNNINELIIRSNQSFKPPLREFNEQQINIILDKFNSKEEKDINYNISPVNYNLTWDSFKKCEDVLWNFSKIVSTLIYSSVAFKGGYILNSIQPNQGFNLTPDAEMAMSFSLFDTSSRYAWLLKKMNITSIFLDCNHYMHFIMGFNGGIFSSFIYKDEKKIGFIRLLLPKYLGLIEKIVDAIIDNSYPMASSHEKAISTLMIR